jgi:hypothetical protein
VTIDTDTLAGEYHHGGSLIRRSLSKVMLGLTGMAAASHGRLI